MSRINVIAYSGGIPANNKNLEKPAILKNFIEGVNKVGDYGMVHEGMHLPSQVALIQGWVHEIGQRVPHLQIRKNVIDMQRKNNAYTITADSNLFLYKNTDNPHHYLRYSFNGIFPTTGLYCDDNPDPKRWNSIRKTIGIKVKDWRTSGNHILLCLQRNGGWSMKGKDIQEWALETITQIKKYTDRPIIVRGHPGDKNTRRILSNLRDPKNKLKNIRNVTISPYDTNLEDYLRNCWAVVGHNSSPAVGAAIEGIPVFLTDPSFSQARDIANTDLSIIENPIMLERTPWLQRLSMFHWNFDELKSGEAWSHMRQYIK